MPDGVTGGGLLWRWRLAHGLHMRPEEIELYGLESGDRDPFNFVGYRFFERAMLPVLNDQTARVLADNKWIFCHIAGALGLPIPRTFALYDTGHGVTHDGQPCLSVDDVLALLQREDPDGLVIKPPDGLQGRGVVIYDELDMQSGLARLQSGETVEIRDEIQRVGPGQLIQERVAQHVELSRINPHTTNTIRVVTHVFRDGHVRIPFAVARFGRAGNVVDNWDQGGISVGVEVDTGKMQEGVLKPKYGGRWVTSHPDTGIEFRGSRLPMWDDVVRLCRLASGLLPGLRSIGWDIVISPDGPVILEANERWDLIMVQAHTDGWLAQPGVRDDLANDGIELPQGVPSASRTAVQVIRRRLAKLGQKVARKLDTLPTRPIW